MLKKRNKKSVRKESIHVVITTTNLSRLSNLVILDFTKLKMSELAFVHALHPFVMLQNNQSYFGHLVT
jgi:hypothetical protein